MDGKRIHVFASVHTADADDGHAVMMTIGDTPYPLTLGNARSVSNLLAIAADTAEKQLDERNAQQLDGPSSN